MLLVVYTYYTLNLPSLGGTPYFFSRGSKSICNFNGFQSHKSCGTHGHAQKHIISGDFRSEVIFERRAEPQQSLTKALGPWGLGSRLQLIVIVHGRPSSCYRHLPGCPDAQEAQGEQAVHSVNSMTCRYLQIIHKDVKPISRQP